MNLRIPFSALLLAAALTGGVYHPAHAQSVEDVIQIANYRAALDQISAGKPENARLLLESSLQHGEISPESAVLLAYLEEKAGDAPRARQTLQGVTAPSPFVSAYLSRFGAPNISVEVARREAVPVKGGATLESTDARITKLEKAMFQIVNAERAANKLPALDWNERLASVARAHSAEMRDKKYFAHESPTPELRHPLDRYVAAFGKTPRLVAENIFRAWGDHSFLTEKDIRDAHKSLMDSPGHRANILINGATDMGIGIAADSTGNIWLTQMFSRSM